MLRGKYDSSVTVRGTQSGRLCVYWYPAIGRVGVAGSRVIFQFLQKLRFRRRVASLHRAFGIPGDYARQRALPLQMEARDLTEIGPDIYQRPQRLIPSAAAAWRAMVGAAAADGIELQLVSAFRSTDYQCGILRRKLGQGQSIAEILRVSAAPGYSEHHSGRAVDLTTPGAPALEETFEESAAFDWLQRRAAEFGFRMSYPRDNPHGVAYEPWHWAWWGDRPRGA
jgi:D-alanyl-D-alanine carboxypeptidase